MKEEGWLIVKYAQQWKETTTLDRFPTAAVPFISWNPSTDEISSIPVLTGKAYSYYMNHTKCEEAETIYHSTDTSSINCLL